MKYEATRQSSYCLCQINPNNKLEDNIYWLHDIATARHYTSVDTKPPRYSYPRIKGPRIYRFIDWSWELPSNTAWNSVGTALWLRDKTWGGRWYFRALTRKTATTLPPCGYSQDGKPDRFALTQTLDWTNERGEDFQSHHSEAFHSRYDCLTWIFKGTKQTWYDRLRPYEFKSERLRPITIRVGIGGLVDYLILISNRWLISKFSNS